MRRPPAMLRRCWWLIVLLALAAMAAPLAAQAPHPPHYTVQPGDTLADLAERAGSTVAELQRLNNLRDPRALYPGQPLVLPHPAALTWPAHRVGQDETWLTLARRAGLPWDEAARANRALHPGALTLGQRLHLPPLAAGARAASPPVTVTRVALAAHHGLSTWQVRRLNPLPRYLDDPVMLPSVEPASLITSVSVSPQPVLRGQTAAIRVTTGITATCDVVYLERVEPCWGDGFAHLALVGLSALLEPGRHPVEVRVQSAESHESLSVPLHVTAGDYGYSRINLPADRQVLLDPALSQEERVKVAALRPLRSAERLWEYPFLLPVEASVSSHYGSRRSYGYGFTSYHAGTDFRAHTGTPISAPASGVVVLAEPLVVRGNAIIIDHGQGVVTGYWHLARIDVRVGQRVAQGERLGTIGNTGLSTGPHLHWELWINGVAVNPLQWLTDFSEGLIAPASARE